MSVKLGAFSSLEPKTPLLNNHQVEQQWTRIVHDGASLGRGSGTFQQQDDATSRKP